MTRQASPYPKSRHFCTVPIGSQLSFLNQEKEIVTAEPVIVPPSWNKTDSHKALSLIWSRAAQALETAENLFIIGYSMPLTDPFFHYLYSLGTVGKAIFKRVWIFNPDSTGKVKERFSNLLGFGAKSRFEYIETTFKDAINLIENEFKE